MHPTELYPDDLVCEHEAVQATGVPGPVIRQWARRGKIQRFAGDPKQYAGAGHEYKTMYALPEIREHAKTYRPMPQRARRAA
ncbi:MULTISPECIES: hypothetical protein [Streptomyces]|uniref:Uncharacterized protein n=2 Tax=Streptomyces TaxID=1883 RepID=A0A124ECX6_9ACTN|nr:MULTISPECIES: hypothetical protein [Streptomyces]KUH39036.1 hypothetical protein ATE80_09495 [Streptomyces kanasensis]UUS34604.1 hypothetical protein NRO40_29835 [Streptomyces changanensis]